MTIYNWEIFYQNKMQFLWVSGFVSCVLWTVTTSLILGIFLLLLLFFRRVCKSLTCTLIPNVMIMTFVTHCSLLYVFSQSWISWLLSRMCLWTLEYSLFLNHWCSLVENTWNGPHVCWPNRLSSRDSASLPFIEGTRTEGL